MVSFSQIVKLYPEFQRRPRHLVLEILSFPLIIAAKALSDVSGTIRISRLCHDGQSLYHFGQTIPTTTNTVVSFFNG
jgi:hypothetical protein